ncbi:MAG: YtxH domain-containing protein [Vicinamibacterales bacterium]
MTERYDRERVDHRYDTDAGGSFVMGLLTGTVLGAGLGMLFAPKAGSELRNQISEQAGTLANNAQEGYRRATETANEWADKGRGMVDRARDAVSRGADEASRYAREATEGASGAGSTGSMGSPGTGPYGSGSKPGSSF